ncbi:MAG: hypothetical protein M1835_007011 [Candelina submexicana]|nr:MAG: hypothetical protein M1835_007011 [Candelina submexicana]
MAVENMAASMNELPLEVLLIIYSYCDIGSLKKARLVRQGHSISRYALAFRGGVDCFLAGQPRKPPQHCFPPSYQQYVKKIIYLGDMLQSYTTLEHWARQIDNRLAYREWLRINHPAFESARPLEHMNAEQQDQYIIQRRNLEKARTQSGAAELSPYAISILHAPASMFYSSGFGFELLRTSVEHLKNLERIQVLGETDNSTKSVWSRLKAEILVGPDDHRYGQALACVTGSNGVVQLIGILWACEVCQRPIKALDVGSMAPEFWPQFSTMEDQLHTKEGTWMKFPFNHLKNLALDLECDAYKADEARALSRGVGKFLDRAIQVETLNLSIWRVREDPDNPSPPLDFLEFALEAPLPRLRHLKLSLQTREDSIVRLLRNHSSTLRSLSLKCVRLLSGNKGSWRSVIQQLPHILRLDKVYLENLRDSEFGADILPPGLFEWRSDSEEGTEYEKAIEHYALRGGEFPTLEEPPGYGS